MPGPQWWWQERGVILPGSGDVRAEQLAHDRQRGSRGA